MLQFNTGRVYQLSMQEKEAIPGMPDTKKYKKGKWILAEPMEQIEGPGSGAHCRIAGFDLAP